MIFQFSRLTIDENGILIVVTPFNEAIDDYGRAELRHTEIEGVTFDINETLTHKDIQNLEISTFEYVVSDGRLSGKIGILPSGRGYCELSFAGALYALVITGI